MLFHWAYKFAHTALVAFAFIFRPAMRGVNVAVWRDGRLLIIKNSYRQHYSVPGGYVKSGESSQAAAVRELAEEVGIEAYPNQLKPVNQYVFKVHYKRETIDIFELTVGSHVSVSVDNREVVWAGFMTPDKALTKDLCLPAKTYLEELIRIRK